jgi:hypothetical protein
MAKNPNNSPVSLFTLTTDRHGTEMRDTPVSKQQKPRKTYSKASHQHSDLTKRSLVLSLRGINSDHEGLLGAKRACVAHLLGMIRWTERRRKKKYQIEGQQFIVDWSTEEEKY